MAKQTLGMCVLAALVAYMVALLVGQHERSRLRRDVFRSLQSMADAGMIGYEQSAAKGI